MVKSWRVLQNRQMWDTGAWFPNSEESSEHYGAGVQVVSDITLGNTMCSSGQLAIGWQRIFTRILPGLAGLNYREKWDSLDIFGVQEAEG